MVYDIDLISVFWMLRISLTSPCPWTIEVVFAVIRVVTALFLQETLNTAANDADMQLENSRRLAMEYQAKLEENWAKKWEAVVDTATHLLPSSWTVCREMTLDYRWLNFFSSYIDGDVALPEGKPVEKGNTMPS